MNMTPFSTVTKALIGLTITLPLTGMNVWAQESATEAGSAAFQTIMLADGEAVDRITVNSPSDPPGGVNLSVRSLDSSASASPPTPVMLEVPAFNYSFGAFATAGAMAAGYYDRNSYDNMYTGPTNGGVMPMDNTSWGTVNINGETLNQCPLSATRQGLDGRTSRGHVDDYWIKTHSAGPDPYVAYGSEHWPEDCTGDFMKSSKWFGAVGKNFNHDGDAIYYLRGDGLPTDVSFLEITNFNLYDAGYGLKLFYESRGYTVNGMYNQYIDEQNLTYGFTHAQYKAEIDAGRPVIIHMRYELASDVYTFHTMVGIGYDASSNTIYMNDGYDHSTHEMTWGGIYDGIWSHTAVTVVELAPSSVFNPPGGSFPWSMFLPTIIKGGSK